MTVKKIQLFGIYIHNYLHVQVYNMNIEHTNKISLCSLEVINLTH